MTGYYSLTPQAVIRPESFGGLLFDRQTWRTYKLNHTAYLIVSIIGKGPISANRLYTLLSSALCDFADAHGGSVDEFVDRLRGLDLIADAPKSSQEPDFRSVFAPLSNRPAKSPNSNSPSYLSAPLFVWWDITAVCNLKCKQCYSKSGKRLRDELSTAEIHEILDQLAEMNVFYVYFLGGEPLLRRDFLDIVQYSRSCGLEVMISTNGWFMTEAIAQLFADIGVRHVRVSIDGASALTHDKIRGVNTSFDKAVEAVRALKGVGIPVVGVTPTIMRDNIDEVYAIAKLAHSLGVDEIQFVQFCPVGRGENIPSLRTSDIIGLKDGILKASNSFGKEMQITASEGVWEKPFKQCVMDGTSYPDIMGCGAGRTCLAISPNGRLRACLLFQYEIGDLRKQGFQEIWAGVDGSSIEWLRESKAGCFGCKFSSACSGPCPMEEVISPAKRRCFVRQSNTHQEKGNANV